MAHGGAGKYYAPNECVMIAVITIVVQWCALQKVGEALGRVRMTIMPLPMRTSYLLIFLSVLDRQHTINNTDPLILPLKSDGFACLNVQFPSVSFAPETPRYL
jgi:hypothetical protein